MKCLDVFMSMRGNACNHSGCCVLNICCVPVPSENIVAKGRLGPGQMVVADLETSSFAENAAVSKAIATKHPYKEWVAQSVRRLEEISPVSLCRLSQSWTQRHGAEAAGARQTPASAGSAIVGSWPLSPWDWHLHHACDGVTCR